MFFKHWFIYLDKKRAQKLKELDSQRTALGEEKYGKLKAHLPKPKKVEYFSIKLNLFSKENKGLGVHYDIDGVDHCKYFYFIIPWLISFTVTVNWNHDRFKATYPELMKDDISKEWSFIFTQQYWSFYWNYSEDVVSGKRSGFKKFVEVSDLLKGPVTHHLGHPSELVLTTTRPLKTSYRTESGGEEIIQLQIQVRKKEIVYFYKRWFSKTYTRWDVICETPVTVPGKGENGWDCGDEVLTSTYRPELDTSDFTVGSAKNAEMAADAYVDSIIKKLKR